MSGTGNRIVTSSQALPTQNQMYQERNHNYQSKASVNTLQTQDRGSY